LPEQALRRADDAPITLGGRAMGPIRHICAFFHTKEEEYRTLRDFIVEGLARGEKAFHVVDARRREAHLDFLRGTGLDTTAALARGQLEVRGWEQAYLRDGYFDQNRMLALIEEALSNAAAQGYPLTRLVANMEWALEARSGVGDIVEYETRLKAAYPIHPEVFDRLVEPLLGGVHAGRADHLSARSTVPDLEALARSHRSLYLALRRRRRGKPVAPPGPTLVSLDGGLGRLVDALLARLGAVDLRFGTAVTGLVRDPAGWRVVLGDGSDLAADAVVLATPAYATAELLAPHSASGAAALREIGYVDVATVTLAYPAPSVGRRLDATGFLVPPRDGRLVVGCTWLSAKWPHLAGGPEVLVRCLVGRAGDDRWAAYDDAALADAVHGELAEVLRLAGPPTAVHVQRWPKALPQYAVGHQGRLDRVAAALAGLPGLHVTGAAYRGAGVASCIAQAEQVARLVAATGVPAGVGR